MLYQFSPHGEARHLGLRLAQGLQQSQVDHYENELDSVVDKLATETFEDAQEKLKSRKRILTDAVRRGVCDHFYFVKTEYVFHLWEIDCPTIISEDSSSLKTSSFYLQGKSFSFMGSFFCEIFLKRIVICLQEITTI